MKLGAAWRALWETRSSLAGGLIVAAPREPVWTPRRYDRLAEEGYQKNLVAFAAINAVARAAASVPWLLYRRAGAARGEIEAHPLLTLLRRPNPLMGGGEFMEAVVANLLIAGNSYLEAVAPSAGPPREVWPLRPDRMRVLPDEQTGLPRAYVYAVGGRERRWPADPLTGRSAVLHLRTFHPLNDFYGLAPLEAAAQLIDLHNAANAWNMALLQNSAAPSGALVFAPKDGATLTDAQRERLKADLAEGWTGARRAGRPLVLEGGWEWKQIALSPKDLDWQGIRQATARDIALAFGVPPMLLGIPGDNTYSNLREARLAFWEDTVVPLLRRLRDDLNGWLAPQFAPEFELDLDLDEVPALTLRREAKFAMLEQANFLTDNEKRRATGYGDRPDGDHLPPARAKPKRLPSGPLVPGAGEGRPAEGDTQ